MMWRSGGKQNWMSGSGDERLLQLSENWWKLEEFERNWKKLDEIAKATITIIGTRTGTKIRIRIKTRPRQGEMITRQEKLRVDNVLNNSSGELMNELLNYWIIEQMDESWMNRGWTDALCRVFCDSLLWTIYEVSRVSQPDCIASLQTGRPSAQPAKREALRGKSRGKNLESSIAQKEKSDIHRGLRNAHPRSIRLLPVILYRISYSILLF